MHNDDSDLDIWLSIWNFEILKYRKCAYAMSEIINQAKYSYTVINHSIKKLGLTEW